MTYSIQNADTNELIAADLNAEGVEAWWAKNETAYFGLRIVDNMILVVAAE